MMQYQKHIDTHYKNFMGSFSTRGLDIDAYSSIGWSSHSAFNQCGFVFVSIQLLNLWPINWLVIFAFYIDSEYFFNFDIDHLEWWYTYQCQLMVKKVRE
jgi:hypothetical protein